MDGERYQHTLTQIGRYELIAEIGRGGMGVVYRAYEPALDRTIALKLLAPELAHQPNFVARLRREAISAARLRHAHIALLYEFGQADDTAFLAMEHVPGRSLRQLLEVEPPSPERALTIIEQIGQALDYAHCKGIVHRDVKPGNILVGPDGHAMLIDFGLAEVSEHTQLTSPGTVLGSPHYMAPEQAAGRSADARSDQYALAAVAYELLTGAPPFHGRSATAIVHAHIYELPPPPTERCPALPVAVNAALMRGLAKRPGERYATLAEFVAALRAALTPPAPARSGYVPMRRLILGGAGTLVMIMVALLATFLATGASSNGLRRVSAQTSVRSGVPVPRQVIWAYASEHNLVGGPAPAASDGVMVVGTLDGQVLGLQAGSGELIWRAGGASTVMFGAPSASDGLVFVGSADAFVQGLSLRSGKTTWRTRVVGTAELAPTLDAGRLIVITDKGYIYMLQAGSGQVIWDRPLTQSMQPPAIGAGRIFVSAGSTLYALDANDGAVDWVFEAASMITTRAVIAGDMVVVGTERGLLYALRVADGQPHLHYQASGAVSAAPAADTGTIYVADQSGNLTAISLANATMLWRFHANAAIMAAPLLADGKLFFGAADGRFYTLDAHNGKDLAHIQLGGSVIMSPALGDGLIIVRADRVYALGE
jgi:outer membrane protein assembly factor BamB/predicted Ser/Thr protein kinase